MKVKVGTVVESDFGRGPVVAMSREWCIHECRDGSRNKDGTWPQVAVPWEDGVSIPAEPDGEASEVSELEL